MFLRRWLPAAAVSTGTYLAFSSVVTAQTNDTEKEKYNNIIIGAGWAGLGVAAALSSNKVDDYLVLEKGDCVGYFWSKLYDSIIMNTYRHRLWRSPLSIEPSAIQDYRDKDGVLDYLNKYAQHHDVTKHIQFNSEVTHIKYDETNEEWIINLTDGKQLRTNILTMATSIDRVPYIPEFKNMDKYKGRMLHTFDYSSALQFDDIEAKNGKRKFLIIGCGNSSIEIAGEIKLYAQDTNDVTLLVRNGRHVTKDKTKHRFETVLNKVCSPSPFSEKSLLNDNLVSCNDMKFHSDIIKFDKFTNFMIMTDMTKHGIQKPKLSPTADHYYNKKLTIVDRGTVPLIQKKKIQVNNKIVKQFTESGVEFEDGTMEDFDVVVFGTGYRHGLDELFGDEVWGKLGTKEYNYPDGLLQMYKDIPKCRAYDWPNLNGRGRSKSYDNLYFAGFDQGYLGGLTIGIYSWAIGEEIAVKLGKVSLDECTIPWIKSETMIDSAADKRGKVSVDEGTIPWTKGETMTQ